MGLWFDFKLYWTLVNKHNVFHSYAVVKKEPPPRPPAPVRRKRSTRSLGDRQFFTMPLRRKDAVPERPVRNYSTIGPTRPARRVSLTSLEKYVNQSV